MFKKSLFNLVIFLSLLQPALSKAEDTVALQVSDPKEHLSQLADYKRSADQTYLTLPEWYIVYNYDEYAAFLKEHAPSGFPYFGSIREFWSIYAHVYSVTCDRFPMNWGYHGMIVVIGVSFTVENVMKGLYENTVGRLAEWSAHNEPTEEDQFIQKAEYAFGTFTHLKPWYEFPFLEWMSDLNKQMPWFGKHPLRKFERRSFLIQQYSLKAIYAWMLGAGTQASYDAEADTIYVWIQSASPQALAGDSRVQVVVTFSDQSLLIKIPRYETFQEVVKRLAHQGVQFIQIAGNDEILVTALAKRTWQPPVAAGEFLFHSNVVTQPERKRVALKVSVPQLSESLLALEREGATVEHIYDY